MSTRLATDSRPAITVRRRAQVDVTSLAAATVAVAAYGLIGQHENPVGLAVQVAVGVTGGIVFGRNLGRRNTPQRHTVTGYAVRAVFWTILAVIGVTLFESVLGAPDGVAAGVFVGTLADRVVAYRKLDD